MATSLFHNNPQRAVVVPPSLVGMHRLTIYYPTIAVRL